VVEAGAAILDAAAIDGAARALDSSLDAPPPRGTAVVAHGGIGSDPSASGTALAAAHTALAELARGGAPIAAAAQGAAVLEDAPGFNAGTGASVRLDRSIQMDAAVMDSTGRWTAVLAIERVKNPVLVALSALDAGGVTIAGEGAAAFARSHGHGDWDPSTPAAIERRSKALEALTGTQDAALPDWSSLARDAGARPDGGAEDAGADATATRPLGEAQGSVAVLVRAGGDFAGAVSDGGPVVALRGSVGSVAARGAALHVGPAGAVAVSGGGDGVVRDELARAVYERMRLVLSAKAAATWGVQQIEPGERVGITALNEISMHSAASEPMAWAEWSSSGVRTGEVAP
jgi:isoaspartyl peptidase/L-asparaginase-like protein (Ntn-hydrolase superfamily)